MSKRHRQARRNNQPRTHCASAPPAVPPVLLEDSSATVEPSGGRTAGGRWTHAAVATLLMALCAGLYAWTADFPMVFDDHAYLTQNPVFLDVKSFGYPAHFEQFANSPAKAGNDPDLAVNFILRPVAYASFYLNYLMDGFKPRWFRVVNIVIHALNSLLIYALLNSLLRRSAAGDLKRGSVLFIAATAALIFAAHPLAIESVTYIIQRFTSLAVLFSLLALWLHFTSLSARSRLGLWLLRSAAVVAMLLAMQTKEESFTVPFLAVLLDWLVVGSRLRLAVVRALPLLLCAPLIPALVILTAAAQHGGAFNWEASINIVNDRHTPLNHWHYIVTELTVVAHYLRQLFWPAGLNLDPAWPKYESLWQGPVLVALGVLTGLIAAAWCLFRRFRGDVRFALGFAFTLWFFITVSPSSGLVPLPDLMAEHRSYLPSIGIFVLVACLLDRLRSANLRSSWAKVLVPAAAVLCVGALSWATCARNKVWSTRESLWEDTVAKSPGKYRTWGNLGAVYSAGGNEEKAVACFRAALKIEPRFQNGLLNLSNSLLRLNRPKESLDTTQQLIQMDQTAATKLPVAFTLGIGLAGVGRYDEAITTFTNILAAVPDNIQARKALGLVYLQTGLPQRALAHFQAAAGIQPADAQLQAFIKAAENAMAANTGSAAARLRLQ